VQNNWKFIAGLLIILGRWHPNNAYRGLLKLAVLDEKEHSIPAQQGFVDLIEPQSFRLDSILNFRRGHRSATYSSAAPFDEEKHSAENSERGLLRRKAFDLAA